MKTRTISHMELKAGDVIIMCGARIQITGICYSSGENKFGKWSALEGEILEQGDLPQFYTDYKTANGSFCNIQGNANASCAVEI